MKIHSISHAFRICGECQVFLLSCFLHSLASVSPRNLSLGRKHTDVLLGCVFVQWNASTESIALVQIVSEGMGDAFVRLRLKDQAKSLDMITHDSQLSDLRQLRAPLVDYEVRGLPALTYFGGMVWRDAINDYAQGELSRSLLAAFCRF